MQTPRRREGGRAPPSSRRHRCRYACGSEQREGGTVTSELMTRAWAGDGDAFRELTEPHRRELHVHCYRMLGSLQDAEDAMQDTLLAAWQGFGAFEGRS